MQKQRGFTVLELIVAIAFLVIAGTFFFIQKRDIEVASRDSTRKLNINSIYYNLEDIYFPANAGYPEFLTADQLKGLDPATLKDPQGKTISEEGSNYNYTPKDCTAGKCKSYTLTADLESEGDYTKESRNK